MQERRARTVKNQRIRFLNGKYRLGGARDEFKLTGDISRIFMLCSKLCYHKTVSMCGLYYEENPEFHVRKHFAVTVKLKIIIKNY